MLRTRRSAFVIGSSFLLLLWGGSSGVAATEEARAPETFEERVAPFVEKHCTSCHNEEKRRGDLSLAAFKSAQDVVGARDVWEGVARRIVAREMPPRERPQPVPEEVEAVRRWIEAELARMDREAKRDPGRVTIRRLNRTEYSNTVRDLLGVEYPALEELPSDDVGYGFDNIGDVLSLPPIVLEKYLRAAEGIAAEALKPDSSSRERLLVARPGGSDPSELDACARKVLENLLVRAFRRPVEGAEVERFLRLARTVEADGGSFEDGIRLALEAVLVSPHFLFRVELDPDPENPQAVHPVNDFELASRISYFLWSTMPDPELLAKAREGSLRDEAELEAQARRMLADRRSRALVENFAAQWLQIRGLLTAAPDPARFPSFNDKLRSAMLRETELFVEHVIREDRSVLELLDADYTFLNERLARHYGVEGVEGEEFRKVQLPDGPRGGILTHGSVLTATSNPTRTSPVKRGKWVLEVLLGVPPPPPPPNVPNLSDKPEAVLSGSLRRRMEQHRADPACSTCHERMDPLGFGLENFNAVGAWRQEDGGFPIDASGLLPDGRAFGGPKDLRAVLRGEALAFRRTLASKMLTYALGRGLEAPDRLTVDGLVESLEAKGDRFSALVVAIVRSEPFRMRRGERGKP